MSFNSESVLQIVEKKNRIGYPLYKYPFKQEKPRWNSFLVLDNVLNMVLLTYNKEEW